MAVAAIVKGRAELEFIGEVADGHDALERIRTDRPDIVVLDVVMPGLDGLAVLNAVVRDALPTRVLLLTAELDPRMVYEAIGAGAAGCLLKDAGPTAIGDAIVAVGRGETVLGPELLGGVAQEIRLRSVVERPLLTHRELEILALTAGGSSARQVAEALTLSPATVRTHLQHLYAKLGVSDRAAAVAEAMRRGLLE
jgi:two-component system nitrate/nitrite response regulator NarL